MFTPSRAKPHIRQDLTGSLTRQFVTASPVGQSIHTNSPIGCHPTYRMAVQGPEAHSSLDTDVWGHFLALSFSSVFSSYPDFPVGLGQLPVLLPPPPTLCSLVTEAYSSPSWCFPTFSLPIAHFGHSSDHFKQWPHVLLWASLFPSLSLSFPMYILGLLIPNSQGY